MRYCAGGACSCAAGVLLPQSSAAEEPCSDGMNALKAKIESAQKRFAKLVQILNESIDEPVRKGVWEALGRDHGREFSDLTSKYKGNLRGFLEDLRSKWVEKAEFDEQRGTIRIVDKARDCTCPLVKKGLTPPDFCNCTLGWQKEVYSAITGRPVEASVEESVLRGGRQCIFRIQIL
jgi:hypothetical protein